METLLNKDRIEKVNPYLFQKIQNKINQKQDNIVPLWGLSVLKYCVIGLVLLMGFNAYMIFNQSPESNFIAQTNPQTDSYNEFFNQGHFEALSSLYPVELLANE